MDDIDNILKKEYISDGYKIPYKFILNENAGKYSRYLIVFTYNDKEYIIPAPLYNNNKKNLTSFIIGSGFYVEDKVDDLNFSAHIGKG